MQFNGATLPGQVRQTAAVTAVKTSRWLVAQGASRRRTGSVHLENEMVTRRQQAIDCHTRWQQGECGVKQGVASGYERECPLNVVIGFSHVIRVHRKCGRTLRGQLRRRAAGGRQAVHRGAEGRTKKERRKEEEGRLNFSLKREDWGGVLLNALPRDRKRSAAPQG